MSGVNVEFYLIVGQRFDKHGAWVGRSSVRVAARPPALKAHEVAVFVNTILPKSLFVRPSLSASIVVPEGQAPMTITPEVESNIAAVLREQLGITLRIEAPEGTA